MSMDIVKRGKGLRPLRLGGPVRSNVLRRAGAIAVTLLMVVPLMAVLASPAAADTPGPGTYFKYEYEQRVRDSTDAYYGYKDDTEGTGHYEVISWGPDEASVAYSWEWTYDNNEGDWKSGSDSGVITFDLATRMYTCDRIDLDDAIYASEPPETLGQWIWVPPDVKKGDKLWILDEEWTVTDTDATLWVGWTPRKLIEVTSSGNWHRDDDYGVFDYTYTDRLYFCKDNGMFYAERYNEHDEGTWLGDYASFNYFIEINVVEASYTPEVDWTEGVITYTFWSFVIFAIFGSIFWVGYRIRWMTKTGSMRTERMVHGKPKTSSETVKVKRVHKMEDLPKVVDQATVHFGPFLGHMIEKTLLAGDRVAIATTQFNDLVGIGFYNKEAKVGTILAKGTEVTETIRKYLKVKDFFTEHKHRIKVRSSYYMSKETISRMAAFDNAAYNVFETHKVYRLEGIKPTTYDPDLVRPMKEGDLPAVIALAKKVYKTKAKRWITAAYQSGDLGYVAEVDGNIVGFGFACVCGDDGRLHTLGVHPDHRGKGIAKELHRARLETMRRLGVTTVIDEIADWNLASIRISTLSGFKPVGRMWVETVRTKRIKRNIVRR